MKKVHFRIGTTSYIVPDDILPNVQFLAGKVDDVELVLFEVDEGENNLPDDAVINAIHQTMLSADLTCTVHLPLDLRLGDDLENQTLSIIKALRVIRQTARLKPWAYVLHLDGRSVRTVCGSRDWEEWNLRTRQALTYLSGELEEPRLLSVENLDGYPPDFWDPALEGLPFSRCVDIGHLWKDGYDPLPFLEKHIENTRVLHIHGIAQRDHQSLQNVPALELRRIMDFLVGVNYEGVLTMEIFGEDDFYSSREVLLESLHQMKLEAQWENR